MSTSDTSSKGGAPFLWVLGAFAGFAVLFSVLQATARQGEYDPRASLRTESRAEIAKAQGDLVSKMGLDDAARKDSVFAKTVTALQAKKAGASAQVVPGSPTQLKQSAAAAAPAPVPAAPAPATPAATPPPAAPAAPAPAAPAPGN